MNKGPSKAKIRDLEEIMIRYSYNSSLMLLQYHSIKAESFACN